MTWKHFLVAFLIAVVAIAVVFRVPQVKTIVTGA